MNRLLSSIVALSFVLGMSGAAGATQCRDAHGHFMKCKAVMKKPMTRCRDKHGRFIKCSHM